MIRDKSNDTCLVVLLFSAAALATVASMGLAIWAAGKVEERGETMGSFLSPVLSPMEVRDFVVNGTVLVPDCPGTYDYGGQCNGNGDCLWRDNITGVVWDPEITLNNATLFGEYLVNITYNGTVEVDGCRCFPGDYIEGDCQLELWRAWVNLFLLCGLPCVVCRCVCNHENGLTPQDDTWYQCLAAEPNAPYVVAGIMFPRGPIRGYEVAKLQEDYRAAFNYFRKADPGMRPTGAGRWAHFAHTGPGDALGMSLEEAAKYAGPAYEPVFSPDCEYLREEVAARRARCCGAYGWLYRLAAAQAEDEPGIGDKLRASFIGVPLFGLLDLVQTFAPFVTTFMLVILYTTGGYAIPPWLDVVYAVLIIGTYILRSQLYTLWEWSNGVYDHVWFVSDGALGENFWASRLHPEPKIVRMATLKYMGFVTSALFPLPLFQLFKSALQLQEVGWIQPVDGDDNPIDLVTRNSSLLLFSLSTLLLFNAILGVFQVIYRWAKGLPLVPSGKIPETDYSMKSGGIEDVDKLPSSVPGASFKGGSSRRPPGGSSRGGSRGSKRGSRGGGSRSSKRGSRGGSSRGSKKRGSLRKSGGTGNSQGSRGSQKG